MGAAALSDTETLPEVVRHQATRALRLQRRARHVRPVPRLASACRAYHDGIADPSGVVSSPANIARSVQVERGRQRPVNVPCQVKTPPVLMSVVE